MSKWKEIIVYPVTIGEVAVYLTNPREWLVRIIRKYPLMIPESEGIHMLNMTIEQFKQQLDEMLEHYKQIIGKQRQIRLSAVNNTILCYEAEILLRFAKENKLPVKIEYDAEEDTFSYSYLIEYENVYLQAFSKEKEYQLYKKGGLVS